MGCLKLPYHSPEKHHLKVVHKKFCDSELPPITIFQPWQSPYSSMDGNPVNLTDVRGLSTDKRYGDRKKVKGEKGGAKSPSKIKQFFSAVGNFVQNAAQSIGSSTGGFSNGETLNTVGNNSTTQFTFSAATNDKSNAEFSADFNLGLFSNTAFSISNESFYPPRLFGARLDKTGWELGLFNSSRRWWKKNIGWWDKGANWRWKRNTHTINVYLTWARYEKKSKKREWSTVSEVTGVGTNGVDINYLSQNRFRYKITFDDGSVVTISNNNGAFRLPRGNTVGPDGRARTASGRLLDGAVGTGPAGLFKQIDIPQGVNYEIKIEEYIEVEKVVRFWFFRFTKD